MDRRLTWHGIWGGVGARRSANSVSICKPRRPRQRLQGAQRACDGIRVVAQHARGEGLHHSKPLSQHVPHSGSMCCEGITAHPRTCSQHFPRCAVMVSLHARGTGWHLDSQQAPRRAAPPLRNTEYKLLYTLLYIGISAVQLLPRVLLRNRHPLAAFERNGSLPFAPSPRSVAHQKQPLPALLRSKRLGALEAC
jgi:hypothetical protein